VQITRYQLPSEYVLDEVGEGGGQLVLERNTFRLQGVMGRGKIV